MFVRSNYPQACFMQYEILTGSSISSGVSINSSIWSTRNSSTCLFDIFRGGIFGSGGDLLRMLWSAITGWGTGEIRFEELEFDSSLIGKRWFELEELGLSKNVDLNTEFEGIIDELFDPFRDSSGGSIFYLWHTRYKNCKLLTIIFSSFRIFFIFTFKLIDSCFHSFAVIKV